MIINKIFSGTKEVQKVDIITQKVEILLLKNKKNKLSGEQSFNKIYLIQTILSKSEST